MNWRCRVQLKTRSKKKYGYGLPNSAIQLMGQMGVDEWHLCGLETDACVLACAFNLWDAGVRPVLLERLCRAPDDYAHQRGIEIVRRQFGEASVKQGE